MNDEFIHNACMINT